MGHGAWGLGLVAWAWAWALGLGSWVLGRETREAGGEGGLVSGVTGAIVIGVVALGAIAAGGQAPARVPDVHYTPTRHAIADAMLRLADVGPDDVVYDLGAGDGRIPIIAAQKYGARGVGIEIDPALVARARENARDAGVADRVTFVEGDLFSTDLTGATVVTMYLSPNIMSRIGTGLRALAPGTRLVSHQFPIPGWPADRRVTVDEAELLLWVIPERYGSMVSVW